MITVSPNKISNYRKCPACAGYVYVSQDRRDGGGLALQRGRKRGLAIHKATLGEGPEINRGDNVAPIATGPMSFGTEYHPLLASNDARMIWKHLDLFWPGAAWHKEQTLYAQLTPNIRLEGRLDLWGLWQGAYVLPDLKTSTAFHTTELDGRRDNFDHQLILYALLVQDNEKREGRAAPLPQIYRLGYNPNTKRGHRRQFLLSDGLILQAARYAVHVACSLERMQLQEPTEWLRTMQCEEPFPCAYKGHCARDTGAWYSDGKSSPPEAQDSDIARPYHDPVDIEI